MSAAIGVIGSLVRDEIEYRARNEKYNQIGGGVYYAGHALFSSGFSPMLFPILAEIDRGMLLETNFPQDSLFPLWSTATTANRCIYPSSNPDLREVKILTEAKEVRWQVTLSQKIKSFALVSLFPITLNEFASDFYSDLRKNFKGIIAIDAQGIVRGKTIDYRSLLAKQIDWMKTDENEASLLTGKSSIDEAANELLSWGVKEIAITRGSQGSLIFTEKGDKISIDPVPVTNVVDATGCGDTFWAIYSASRLNGSSPEEAGKRGATAASSKLTRRGPLMADKN